MEEELMYCLMGHQMTSTLPPDGAKCDACARSFYESDKLKRTEPNYSCSECNITLHRECAQLPKQIDHHMHPQHPLLLITKPPERETSLYYDFKTRLWPCEVCKEDCNSFMYQCSSCDFYIDVLCAFFKDGEDISITIPTHHHPMRLIRRPATFRCNACSVTQRDESYVCTKPSCGFWMHKKCGSLPEFFKRPDHDHPLLLATSMPDRYRRYKFTCEICRQYFESSAWVYYCQKCKYFIHIYCIQDKAPSELEESDAAGSYIPRLVMIRDEDSYRTLVITRLYNNRKAKVHHEYSKRLEDRRLPQVMLQSHKHPLVLISDDDGDDENEAICDGCIQHIDSPYYKCGQNCNFYLHATCASLPVFLEVGQHIHMHGMVAMMLYFPESPWEAFKCAACNSFCNGYGYRCTWSSDDFFLDIKCSYLMGHIKHTGHKHYLRSTQSNLFTCSACGYTGKAPYLNCAPCNFNIGYECATLPATVSHRWDKHPLILTFPPYFRDDPNGYEEFHCEVCEEEIHPKHWIYRCAECDQSFHPRCIPTLGECRNIKFGKTVSIHDHPHPLTLNPQAKLTSRCFFCRKSLHWSRAFECSPCGSYLCPACLRKVDLVWEEPVNECLTPFTPNWFQD